ncbi:uncharacterized protein LOC143452883 isoform X2 [Clavelina lepadiformis]|uniref:uncharacterized protein LOC143452883 isoform X2 n=1 Tax=Clavelina lepadiformis TaxID=159417 RepID=UPI004042BBE4
MESIRSAEGNINNNASQGVDDYVSTLPTGAMLLYAIGILSVIGTAYVVWLLCTRYCIPRLHQKGGLSVSTASSSGKQQKDPHSNRMDCVLLIDI